MNRYLSTCMILILALFGCTGDDSPKLPSFEERVSTAINGLRADLIAPGQGWRLEYKPTPESGVFFMSTALTLVKVI